MNMKKTCLKFLYLLLGLAVVVACAKDEEVFTGNIMGKVTDAVTGEVLQGVTVSLSPGGVSKTTGSDGTFEFLEQEPRQYEIQARKKGYVTNNKSVTVITGKDIRGDIQLTPEVAKLELSTNALNFGKSHTSLSFEIINEGNINFNWNISGLDNADWLEVAPTSGSLAAGKSYAVQVNVLREKLTESKEITLLVNVDKQSVALKVSAEVEEKFSKITLNTHTLNFGEDYASLTFDIHNEGNKGDADWRITDIDVDWIKVSPTTGTTAMGKSSTVKVDVDREKLPEGDQTTTILVNSEGESQRVSINATGEKRVSKITLSKNTLDFGLDLSSLTFGITNVGNAGDINWEIGGINVDWVKVAPLTGTTSMDKSSAVKVELDREKLPEGKQTTTILVNAYGESFPVTISAEKEIKVAKITLSKTTLDFGLDYSSLTFDITNAGNAGDVSWEISNIDVDWVKVAPLTGTTSMDKSSAVKVELDREKLPEGRQTTTILVNAYGESFPIVINAEGIKKVAKITLSKNTLDFGLEQSLLTFDITNVGNAGDVSWEITNVNVDWVKVSPLTGTTSMDKSSAVKVELDREKLPEGRQTTTILVNAYGESFPVTINAEKEIKVAKITLSKTTLDFGLDLSSLTFGITNVGNAGDINWEIGGINVDWVKVAPLTGTTSMDKSSAVKVELDREKLPEGKQTTTILVNAYGESFPVTISAEKEIKVAKITLSKTTLDFGLDYSSLTFDITNAGNAGDVSWEISNIDVDWVKVAPLTGTTSMDKSSAVKVELDREKLPEGRQTTTILVNAYGESFPIVINAEGIKKVTKITLSKNTLDFGLEQSLLTFDITNVGNAGDVSWEITNVNVDWVKVSPLTGTTSMDKSSAVKVELDREKLPEGKQTTTILVNAYGESFPVTINAEKEIKVAKITLSKTTLDFGLDYSSLTFDITNVGNAGDVSWTITGVDVDWVKVFPVSGTTSMDKSSAVKVEVDREKLSEGRNATTILVEAYGESFPVTIKAEKKPARYIEVMPSSLVLGTSDNATLSVLSHNGTTAYELYGDGDYSWAKFSKTEGVIPEYSSANVNSIEHITISADRTGLAAGTYSFTLIIRSDLGDTRVPVSMTVEEQQIPGGGDAEIISCSEDLEFTLTSCKISGTTATIEMKVKNVGNGNVSLQIYGGNYGYVYDDQGNKYSGQDMRVSMAGAYYDANWSRTDIPAGIMTKLSIKIYNVSELSSIFGYMNFPTNMEGSLILKNIAIEGRTNVALEGTQTTGTVETCNENLNFTLLDCKYGSNYTELKFRVKNSGSNTVSLQIYGGNYGYAYDDQGNKYSGQNMRVSMAGAYYDANWSKTDIPAGIMTNGSIRFYNVDANATEFSNITLKTNQESELIFKNVKIRK